MLVTALTAALVAPATALAATGGAVQAAPSQAAPQATAAVVDPIFSFAVMPDTQNEVLTSDLRFPKRVSWLVHNKSKLDLRWVLHTGDLQNWDTPDHIQFATMSKHLTTLDTVGHLPFIATPGNHDTAAVCPGGSACPYANTNVTVRDTRTWNAYYPPSRFGQQGIYEAGKSDNGWRTFSAGGRSWLVLNLELWPRWGVIRWAQNVVATHPHHNVIVITHAFLTSTGRISTSNGGYGATAPSTLWAALKGYPNLAMIFSGHVGQAWNTTAGASDGHRVGLYLQTFHAAYTNPVRIVTVDTSKGTIRTEVRSNYDNSRPVGSRDVTKIYPFTSNFAGFRWVR